MFPSNVINCRLTQHIEFSWPAASEQKVLRTHDRIPSVGHHCLGDTASGWCCHKFEPSRKGWCHVPKQRGAVPVETGSSVERAWQGVRAFRVARRQFEDEVQTQCSFYLEPIDNQPLPLFRPGQYLTLDPWREWTSRFGRRRIGQRPRGATRFRTRPGRITTGSPSSAFRHRPVDPICRQVWIRLPASSGEAGRRSGRKGSCRPVFSGCRHVNARRTCRGRHRHHTVVEHVAVVRGRAA